MPQLVSSLDVSSAAMKRSEGAKLSSEAYASVREEILSGRLQIGEAVSRNALTGIWRTGCASRIQI
jgi:DNA-binding GntR family transcriptional regulator